MNVACLAYRNADPADPVPATSVVFAQQLSGSTSFVAGPTTTTDSGILVSAAANKTVNVAWAATDPIRAQNSPASATRQAWSSPTPAAFRRPGRTPAP